MDHVEGKGIKVKILGISDHIHKPLENADQELRVIDFLPGQYENSTKILTNLAIALHHIREIQKPGPIVL